MHLIGRRGGGNERSEIRELLSSCRRLAVTSIERDRLAEQVIVLRAQLGARDAWAWLVAHHDARLLFYLRRLLGSSHDAEDVRQDVWLTAIRKLHTLEDAGAFQSWLYQIARRRAYSLLSRSRREVMVPEDSFEDVAVIAADADELTFAPETAAAVHAALDTLSPAHREVLTLRFLSGLRYEAIATVLECAVGTVRSRLHYAKLALRAAVTEDPATLAMESDHE